MSEAIATEPMTAQSVSTAASDPSVEVFAVYGVEPEIRRFAALTQNLERHRSNYVAHLAKQAPDDLAPPFEVAEATLLALSIVDQLLGERCEYTVAGIDLRKAAFGAPET